jgi:hypothetical protein
MREQPQDDFSKTPLVIPPEFRPELYKNAGDLCMEITVWTRDKIDDEGILSLQEKTNLLFQLALDANTENVESDQDYQIYRLQEEIKKEYEKIKEKRKQELIDRSLEALFTIQKEITFDLLMAMRSLEKLLLDNPDLLKAYSSYKMIEYFFIVPDPEKSYQKQFNKEAALSLEGLEKIITLLEKNLSQEPEENRNIQILLRYQQILPVTKAQLANLKWIKLLKSKTILKRSEEEIKKRIEPLLKNTRFKNIFEPQNFSADPDTSPEKLESIRDSLEKWLNGNNQQASFTYNFVSQQERNSKREKKEGSDYNDYLNLVLERNPNQNFDLSLSEKLGVRTFLENQERDIPYKIKEILEKLKEKFPKINITNPLKKDSNMEKAWQDYGHIDLEYRQLQIKIESADKDSSRVLIEAVFQRVIKNQETRYTTR